MKITKRQLRRIIKEACGLDAEVDQNHKVVGIENPADHYSAEVPSPEDYDKVRDFLNTNSDIVDLGIASVMEATGSGCERSTAQGIIDHLKDMTTRQSEKDPYQRGLPQSGPTMIDLSPI